MLIDDRLTGLYTVFYLNCGLDLDFGEQSLQPLLAIDTVTVY